MTARVSLAEYRQLSLWKGKRQRGTRPPPALEFRTQCALAEVLRVSASRDWWWTAFPAGELRTRETGARLKRMGLRPGMADVVLISPDGRFLGLELKRRGERLTDAQRTFRDWCLAHNVAYAVAYSFGEAVAVLKEWGALPSAIEP